MSLIHSAPVAMFRPAGVALICPPQTLKKWGECFDCLDWQADFSATRLGPDDEWALASLFVPGNTKGTDEWARERGVDYRLAQTPTRLSRYAAEPPSTLHVIAVPRERVGVHVCSCPAHHLTHRAHINHPGVNVAECLFTDWGRATGVYPVKVPVITEEAFAAFGVVVDHSPPPAAPKPFEWGHLTDAPTHT